MFIAGLLTYINCRNVTWAARVQDIFTSAKILALMTIIVAGACHLFNGKFLDVNIKKKKKINPENCYTKNRKTA